MRAKSKLVCGIGINDADYQVQNMTTVGGKVTRLITCPYYKRWYGILSRVSGESERKRKYNAYSDVTISEEWKTFSNFKNWMEGQDWEGLQIDKDYLSVFTGKKEYSKDQCAFISRRLNSFMVLRGNDRGSYPLGVTRRGSSYSSKINIIDKRVWLGSHKTPSEAHRAWQKVW